MDESIELKTKPEIARIRRTARILWDLLRSIASKIEPGVSAAEIAGTCVRFLEAARAVPTAEQVNGFPGPVCVSVNNVAAHGPPGPYRFESGDLVTVDICASLDGWFADAAWTYACGEIDSDDRRLIRAAWRASRAGVLAARAGSRLGDVAAAVQRSARADGCSVLPEFAGHGIGRRLHEGPTVRHIGRRGAGQPVVPGLVITVEPILSLGGDETYRLSDRWSHATKDGSRTAQYEHTIAVTAAATENLTCPATTDNVDFPPFF